jgi:hypothetical protein
MPLSVQQGLRFNGLYDYVNIGNGSDMNLSGDFRIDVELKSNGGGKILSKWWDGSTRSWDFYCTDTELTFYWRPSGGSSDVTIMATGLNLATAKTVSVVYSGGTFSLEVDGVQGGTTSTNGTFANNSANVLIGKYVHTSATPSFFKGQIYSVTIRKSGNNVAHYPLNEGHGTTAYDTVGNNHGTIHGATWVVKRAPKGLAFDGVDDYVSFGDLGIVANGEATIEGRYYFDTFAKARGSTVKLNSLLYQHSANDYIYFTSGANYFNPLSVLKVNQWNHIALTYNGDQTTSKLYVNGTLFNISIQTPSTVGIGALSDFMIAGTPSYFDGLIDDIRVWNVARTQEEIQRDTNRELIGTEEGLVGYWKFNEGSGTIAQDSTSNNNDGTIYGATRLKKQATNVKTASRVLTALR